MTERPRPQAAPSGAGLPEPALPEPALPESTLPDALRPWIAHALQQSGPVLWLTGAGISAESGIPTFRGKEGYWRVGSRNYHPQELATFQAFTERPDDVWSWYLYRRSVCRAAAPNAAHRALAALEPALAARFLLVTQNVDGLHLRAGNSFDRTYQIHGNIDFMRCAQECSAELLPLPEEIDERWDKGRPLRPGERQRLVCPRCGARTRPHVLWFDEYYDEPRFRFESSLSAAQRASMLIVVGTAGTTNLPLQIAALAARRGIPLVAINLHPSPFTELAETVERGHVLEGEAGTWVPALAAAFERGAAG
jgi:NAD-dependent deacetylase